MPELHPKGPAGSTGAPGGTASSAYRPRLPVAPWSGHRVESEGAR
jgi:hypothetical protein